MGSAKAQPSCLEKENLKNLRKQGPTCEDGTRQGGGVQHRGTGEMEVGQEKGQKGSEEAGGKAKRSKYEELEKWKGK